MEANASPHAQEDIVFASAKRTILHKLKELIDYSPKGTIDEPIASFVHRLNSSHDLVTTSSCSGRIAIYAHGGFAANAPVSAADNERDGTAEVAANSSSKGAGKWLLVTHTGQVSAAEIHAALKQDAWPGCHAILKVEPFILHVQCRNIPAAQRLMHVAMGAGFRESGIGVGNGGKIIVAVRTTASSLEVPLRVGGRNIVSDAYVDELVAIANARFDEIAARRSRFIAAFDAEYPSTSEPEPASQRAPVPCAGDGASVLCSGCGGGFASRNRLFSHLVPNPAAAGADATAPKRMCPVPKQALAQVPAAPVPAVAPAVGRLACTGCGGGFDSRNRLFKHVESCPPALAQKLAREGGGAGAVAAPAAPPPLRFSPAGAPLLVPSVPLSPHDHAAAEEAASRMQRVLASLARTRAEDVKASTTARPSDSCLAVDWERLAVRGAGEGAVDIVSRLARWGHTATVLHSAAGAPLVAVVGGYCCAGVHGRTNDVLLFDPLTSTWHIPRMAQDATDPAHAPPPPQTRHSATAVPFSAAYPAGGGPGPAAYEPLLILGGHNGPARPTPSAHWLSLSADPSTGGYVAAWHAAEARGSLPAPRWGHLACYTPADAGTAGGPPAPPSVVLCGGRDATRSFDDVWGAALQARDGALPALAWQRIATGGAQWRGRFYHAGSALPSPVGGAVASIAVHGGYPSPYLVRDAPGSEGSDGSGSPLVRPPTAFGVSGSSDGHALPPGATTLLPDVHLLQVGWDAQAARFTAAWVPVPAAAVSTGDAGGTRPQQLPKLEPRCSHSVLALPPTPMPGSSASRGGSGGATARLLLLGGECEDPQHNAAQAVEIRVTSEPAQPGQLSASYRVATAALPAADSHGYASLDAEALASQTVSASAGRTATVALSVARDRVLPMQLRCASVLLPMQAPAAKSATGTPLLRTSHRVLTVGGGAVCFAFGSHVSPSYLATVHVPAVVGAGAATAHQTPTATSSPSPAADRTPALLVQPPDAQWVASALEAAGQRDMRFRAGPATSANVSLDLAGLPAGSGIAGALVQGSKLIAVALTTASRDALACVPEITAAVRAGTMALCAAALPRFDTATHDPKTGGPASMDRLAAALGAHLASRDPPVPADVRAQLVTPGCPGGLPRKLERLGDVLLLPRDAMTHPAWLLPPAHGVPAAPALPGLDHAHDDPDVSLVSAPVWDVMCAVLRAARVARRAEVDTGPTRSSRLQMLRTAHRATAYALPDSPAPHAHTPVPVTGEYQPPPASPASPSILQEAVPQLDTRAPTSRKPFPRGAVDPSCDGWVAVHENGLVYAFDATRTMFSSGNVSEKARVSRLGVPGETVVDLYAGIGYWTLPLLVHGRAGHVHACDWNPDAVRTLRINLAANGVDGPARVTVWPGDNAQLVGSAVEGTAHRVVLGLIPTSERGWPTAVRCLAPAGGWLHVHMNKADHEITQWTEQLTARIGELARQCGRDWAVRVAHVERVKSFAPHVWHIVADVQCTPRGV